jgi:hypothetical protein
MLNHIAQHGQIGRSDGARNLGKIKPVREHGTCLITATMKITTRTADSQCILKVMFPSACSLMCWFSLFHYMFQPTWPSSGV